MAPLNIELDPAVGQLYGPITIGSNVAGTLIGAPGKMTARHIIKFSSENRLTCLNKMLHVVSTLPTDGRASQASYSLYSPRGGKRGMRTY